MFDDVSDVFQFTIAVVKTTLRDNPSLCVDLRDTIILYHANQHTKTDCGYYALLLVIWL